MTNRPREKGTRYEVALLAKLRKAFGPQVERAPLKGIRDAGDYVGVPLPIEAKNTKTLLIPEWARRLNTIDQTWGLFWSGGDKRRSDSPGSLLIVPADFGLYLLQLYANAEGSGCDGPTQ